MPFINMSEHWKALRANVAGVFHTVFMDKYFSNFLKATEHALELLGEGQTVNIFEFMHELTYESASLGLFGSNIQASVPFVGGKGAELSF